MLNNIENLFSRAKQHVGHDKFVSVNNMLKKLMK